MGGGHVSTEAQKGQNLYALLISALLRLLCYAFAV